MQAADIERMFTSGRVVDGILLILGVEFAALTWRARGPRWRGQTIDQILALAPGACLLLALRAALIGAPWIWVATWLSLSLPFHIGDLIRRRVRSA